MRRIAYHEAGHAVARWAQGQRFTRVTVEPDGRRGHVAVSRRCRVRPSDPWPAVESWVVVCLAGEAAEELELGAGCGGRRDRQWVRVLLANARRPDGLADWARCDAAVRALLIEHWGSVVALAAALEDAGTLRYLAAVAVMQAAARPGALTGSLPSGSARPYSGELPGRPM